MGPVSAKCLNPLNSWEKVRGITLLSEGFDTRVKPDFMRIVELKTFNYFLCDLAPDLVVFGPSFLILP